MSLLHLITYANDYMFSGTTLNVLHVSITYLIKTLLDKHLFVIGYRNITSNKWLHIGTHFGYTYKL